MVREAAAGDVARGEAQANQSRISATRAVERAAKRQCKKDERQTEALIAKARDWSAHVFDSKRADSVTCKAALDEECLSEVHALAKSKGEKIPWLDSQVGAPCCAPEAVGGARSQDGRFHGGAEGRARERGLDGR